MDKVKLASGIFGWCSTERVTDRYGAIHMMDRPYEGDSKVITYFNTDGINSLVGKRVRLNVEIVEGRVSSHVGDHALGIYPPKTAPAVGTVVDLGVGKLMTEVGYDESLDIVLCPRDGRKTFWCDPGLFYQLHDQTVNIYAEETADPFSPAPTLQPVNGESAFDNGDGSFQVKNIPPNELFYILPEVEPLGGGMYKLTNQPGAGKRLQVKKANED